MSTKASTKRIQIAHPLLTSITGVYRDGQIELAEVPVHVPEETPVIVTFLESGVVDLQARGIDRAHAAELRARLTTFAEDWDSAEMEVYDHYDTVRANCRSWMPRCDTH